jgi:hypothetical protein
MTIKYTFFIPRSSIGNIPNLGSLVWKYTNGPWHARVKLMCFTPMYVCMYVCTATLGLGNRNRKQKVRKRRHVFVRNGRCSTTSTHFRTISRCGMLLWIISNVGRVTVVKNQQLYVHGFSTKHLFGKISVLLVRKCYKTDIKIQHLTKLYSVKGLTGWPDWPDFRPLGDSFLWVVFKNYVISPNSLGLFIPW